VAARRRARRLVRSPVLRPLGLYAASRLLVLVVAGASAMVSATHGSDPGAGPWPALPDGGTVLQTLGRWDGAWYVHLAEDGYPDRAAFAEDPSAAAFFPLFPAGVRALAAITPLSALGAGVALSLTAGAVASVLVWLLARALADRDAADRMTAMVCFFPGAIVLSMAYAEGLLLAGAAVTLLALVRRRWVLAGVVAGITTAVRPNAVALVAACAWAAAVAVRQRGQWRALAAPVLASTGVLAFFAFLWRRTGELDAWFVAQREGWHERFDFGTSVPSRIADVVDEPVLRFQHLHDVNNLVAVAGLAFLVLGGVALWRWRPPAPVVVYAVVAAALAVGSHTIGARPRLVLAAFPLVMAVGQQLRGWAFAAALGVSAGLAATLALVSFTTLAATP
jgi:Glycosyltransferase family 87